MQTEHRHTGHTSQAFSLLTEGKCDKTKRWIAFSQYKHEQWTCPCGLKLISTETSLPGPIKGSKEKRFALCFSELFKRHTNREEITQIKHHGLFSFGYAALIL